MRTVERQRYLQRIQDAEDNIAEIGRECRRMHAELVRTAERREPVNVNALRSTVEDIQRERSLVTESVRQQLLEYRRRLDILEHGHPENTRLTRLEERLARLENKS